MINKMQAVDDSNATETRSDLEKRNPFFYKIIVSPLSQKFKLRIPAEFVKKYGEQLSDEIYLNVPNSEQPWKLELQKGNNEFFLGKGWQVFMEYYNLENGHLLVFKLDGGLKSHFHVLIFDTSGLEIDYPARRSRVPVSNRSTESRQLEKDVREDQETPDDDVEVVAANGGKSATECPKTVICPKPLFTLTMRPVNVSKPYRMSIPIRHVRKYLKNLEFQHIYLKAAKHEKCYRVRLMVRSMQATVGLGWNKFVLDNDLQAGDECVFELVCPENSTYQVTIVRVGMA